MVEASLVATTDDKQAHGASDASKLEWPSISADTGVQEEDGHGQEEEDVEGEGDLDLRHERWVLLPWRNYKVEGSW